MTCPFCQSETPAQAGFCRACGVELGAVTAADQNENGSADALPAGTLLAGVYAVESVLGQGGFGITYRCHDQMLDRRVAIKEFFPAGCRRDETQVRASRSLTGTHFDEARAQFLAEARLLARCHHAGIVSVYTAFEANSTAYMAMELLHGRDLLQLLLARGGRMGEAEAVPLIERAGEALQFVHETGLLHRDIKPENIIVCDDGRVMLIDFGTAREFIKGQAQGHTIVVTPGYAPLEQYARQAQRGAFTDVYGLAATLYHLLTGSAPPAASDRAMGVLLRPVREANLLATRSVARAVEAALQMEIARRPQSVREFLTLLHAPATATREPENAAKIALAPLPNPVSRSTAPNDETTSLDEAEMARQTAAGFSPLFLPTELEARRQMVAGLRPDPSPVNLAPPTPFPGTGAAAPQSPSPPSALPTTSGAAPPILPNMIPGYATRNAPINDNSGIWAYVVVVAMFLGLLFLIFSASSERQSPQPAYIPGSGSSISIPQSFSSSPSRPVRVPTAAPSLYQAAAQREMESTPGIFPVAVESLPGGAKPSSGIAVSGSTVEDVGQFSPDGERLVYTDKAGVVRVWNLTTHQVVRTLPAVENLSPQRLLLSRDNQKLVGTYIAQDKGKMQSQIQVWDIRSGKSQGKLSFDSQKEGIIPQAVLPDGQVLLFKWNFADYKQRYAMNPSVLWNPTTGKQSPAPTKNSDALHALLSPDGKQFVTGDSAGRLVWSDARSGAKIAEHRTQLTYGDYRASPFFLNDVSSTIRSIDPLVVEAMSFSSDATTLVMQNRMQISIFNAKGDEIRTVPVGNVTKFAVSNGGEWLVEGSRYHYVERNMLRNLRDNTKARLQAPPGHLQAVNFSPDGKEVFGLVTSNDASDRISLVTWRTDARPQIPFSAPVWGASLPFSPSRSAVSAATQMTATSDGNSTNLRDSTGNHSILVSADDLRSDLTFSPDGTLLGFELNNGHTRILRSDSGNLFCDLPASASRSAPRAATKTPVYIWKTLVFSADNSRLARMEYPGNQGHVTVWNLKDNPQRLSSFVVPIYATVLAFSTDQSGLICSNSAGAVGWYDVATGKLRGQLNAAATKSGARRSVLQLLATARQLTVLTEESSTFTVTRYNFQAAKMATSTARKPEISFEKTAESSFPIFDPNCPPMLSPDGQFVVASNPSGASQQNSSSFNPAQGGLIVWDVASGAMAQQLPFNVSESSLISSKSIFSLSIAPDSSRISCIESDIENRQSHLITWQRPVQQSATIMPGN